MVEEYWLLYCGKGFLYVLAQRNAFYSFVVFPPLFGIGHHYISLSHWNPRIIYTLYSNSSMIQMIYQMLVDIISTKHVDKMIGVLNNW